MEPALRDGDWAIAVTRGRPRPGSVVVVEHPERPGFEMAKRVTALEGGLTPGGRALGPGELWVEGDNAGGSTDSRDFGPVRSEQVRGIVVAVWWPPKRWRVL
jgi:type IV secretory pathway protease TraF